MSDKLTPEELQYHRDRLERVRNEDPDCTDLITVELETILPHIDAITAELSDAKARIRELEQDSVESWIDTWKAYGAADPETLDDKSKELRLKLREAVGIDAEKGAGK